MAKKRKKSSTNEAAMPSVDRSWQAEDDLRTIQRAHEIIGDTPRLSAAQAHAKKQRESLERISRLKGKRL